MERFFGFDLGDAESAVSVLPKTGAKTPEVLSVRDAKSFITAYARLMSGELLIGEAACYSADAVERKIRFKSRFLTDPQSEKDIRSFAAGVLGQLYQDGNLIQNEDCCFYIGCPAGWDRNTRERYRFLFEKTGYPPVKVISESRAALVSACQSKHLQVGYDILSHPVLVVDIGSATTDFAYIAGGKEVEIRSGGEVFLGGGIMDELLLEEGVRASKDEKKLRAVFKESEAWKNYCEFAARRLKEKYFSDEDYWRTSDCTQNVQVYYDTPIRLTLRINETIADRILNQGAPQLDGRSFREVFTQSLRDTRKNIDGELPELIFLTGGVSKLSHVADWCREVYPESVIITEIQPEFSVSRGLAWCGKIDEELRDFLKDLQNFIDSTTVERIVSEQIDGLYMRAVDTLTKPILENAVEPVAAWLKTLAFVLEEYTVPICVKHNVPYRALSLSSYLAISEIDIHLDTKNFFQIEQITWLIDAIISILVGLLCGGSGIAIISTGLPGIVTGAVVSLLVLFLGKNRMQNALLQAKIPGPVRKLFPKRYFDTHIQEITDDVRANFYESLEKEKNAEISDRLVDEISQQIEDCLTKMAKVVEIPLG